MVSWSLRVGSLADDVALLVGVEAPPEVEAVTCDTVIEAGSVDVVVAVVAAALLESSLLLEKAIRKRWKIPYPLASLPA